MWSPICDVFDKPYVQYEYYPVDLVTNTFAICEEYTLDALKINLFVGYQEAPKRRLEKILSFLKII